jgi:hypothetical protein
MLLPDMWVLGKDLVEFLKGKRDLVPEMKPGLDALFEKAFKALMRMPELPSPSQVSDNVKWLYKKHISGYRRYPRTVKEEVNARLLELSSRYATERRARPVPPPPHPAPVLALPPRAPGVQATKMTFAPQPTRPAGPPRPPAQGPKSGGVIARTMARLRGKSSAPGAGADAAAGSSVGAGAGAGSATAVVSAFTPLPPATPKPPKPVGLPRSPLGLRTTDVTSLSGVIIATKHVPNPFWAVKAAAAAEAERQSVRGDVPDSPATV